jgi:uncharacterized protein YegJ (DUF2314 family)
MSEDKAAESATNPSYSFLENDRRMNFAIEEGRRSLRSFFDAFVKPTPNQKAFLLKAEFTEGDTTEHIWLADIDASTMPMTGTIGNEPLIKSLSFMQRVEFRPEQISDWMYVEDGYLVGGFTIQVIRAGLSSEERAAYDAKAPYKFRDHLTSGSPAASSRPEASKEN